MKFWKILIAILFTILLLAFARKTTAVRSMHKVVDRQGIVIDHHTVPKQVGDKIPAISTKVTGASEIWLFYRIGKDNEFQSVQMYPKPGKENIFSASIPIHPKGVKAWYYIEATKRTVDGEVKVALPDKRSPDFKPILLKFEGEVPVYIVIPHVLCNFGAIFFAVLALFSSIDVKKGRRTIRQSLKFPIWSFALLLMGFLPFGIGMNYYAFGTLWEAFPFGKDITDNKSQIILLSWIITLILVKGTLFGKDEDKNLVSKWGYSNAVIISFIITVAMYAIPHSL